MTDSYQSLNICHSEVKSILLKQEEWLMNRILDYAQLHNFTKYTSTMAEAWRISIVGLTESISKSLDHYNVIPELHPDEEFKDDPSVAFGILEAQRHRSRGITLSMFLGLMKYYRQSYSDLLDNTELSTTVLKYYHTFIDRCFDRIELGFCEEWIGISQEQSLDELQQTNRSITNEKNKYLTIFDSLPNPVLLVNTANALENINQIAGELFFGLVGSGEKYYNATDLEHPAWLDEILLQDESGKIACSEFERTLPTSTGPCDFHILVRPMNDVSAKFTGTVIIFNDITECVMRERELRRLTQAIDQSPSTVVVTDPEGDIEYVNPKFTELTGYSREEVIGKNPRILKSGFQPQEFYREMWETISAGQDWSGLFHNRKKNGDLFWEQVSISSIKDDNGKIISYVAVKKDITDQKRAEDELRTSEKRFRMLMEQAPFAIEVYNTEGDLQSTNHAWRQLWNIAEEVDLSSSFNILLAEDPVWIPIKEAFRSAVTGHAIDLPEIIFTPENFSLTRQVRIFHTRVYPLRSTGEKMTNLVITYEDITDQKQIEDELDRYRLHLEDLVEERTRELKEKHVQLAHADRLSSLGELAAGVAHELSQPLAIIHGEADIMSMMDLDSINPTEYKEGLQVIRDQANRAVQITDHMTEYSRVNILVDGSIDLREPIQNSLIFLSKQFQNHNIRIDLNLSDTLPMVNIHPLRFEQIVINFLVNARHALDKRAENENESFEKHVWITAKHNASDNVIEFEVEDNGAGMTPEEKARCIEPFYTTKEKGKGTGLGLSIVTEIVDEFNGTFTVDSTLGSGTIMRVTVPVDKSTSVPEG